MNNFLQTISLEEAISLIEQQQRELEVLKSYVAKIKDSMDNINNYLQILSSTYAINDTTNNTAVLFTQTNI
jgi:hypothetical protein